MLWVILGLCVLSALSSLGCLWVLVHPKEEERAVETEAESAEELGLREGILNLMRYQVFEEKKD